MTTKRALEGQQALPTDEYEKEIGNLEGSLAAVQRQYGRGSQMGIDPRFGRQEAAQIYQKGDLDRRMAATEPAFGIATQQGEREANVRNTLDDSLAQYKSDNASAAQKAAFSMAETDQSKKEAMWEIDQKGKELDFNLYKSQANRTDAIRQQYLQGEAEEALLNANLSSNVRMQDIDMYWEQLMNDIQNDLKDYESWSQTELDRFKNKMTQKANAWGGIVSGVTKLASEGAAMYDARDTTPTPDKPMYNVPLTSAEQAEQMTPEQLREVQLNREIDRGSMA